MNKSKFADLSKSNFLVLLLALVGLILFMRPYLGVLAFSVISAYIMYPFFNWLKSGRLHLKNGLAVALTLLVSILMVMIPLIIFLIVAINQANHLIDQLELGNVFFGTENLNNSLENIVNKANEIVHKYLGIKESFDFDSVQQFISNALPKIVKSFINLVLSIVGGIPNFFVLLIVYLYSFGSLLNYHKQIIELLRSISPFDKEITNIYFARIGATIKGMVIGQGAVALSQGFIGALSFMTLGLGNYFFIFFLILSFLSIIPLGGGIIIIPVGIISILFGNYIPGILILLIHFAITSNIDNIIRPALVPKVAKQPAVLILLAAFCGVFYFGFLGIIYGPMILSFLTTTIEMYAYHGKLLNFNK